MFQRKTFVSALLASAVALPAFAQDAAPAAEAAEADGAQRTGIEEITITARKVAENLQQAPLAVSAFDSQMLESMGISDTQDVSALAPNLYLTQTPGSSANLALAIRGVGGAEPLLTREQGVALYMDGAYIARVTGAIMDLVDVERVEVLRGPQGTLYGRNATGGAVNFISRKPTEDFNVHTSVGTGSFGRLNALIRVNTGELLPGLSASGAYVHTQQDGYLNNRLSDDNSDPGSKNTDAYRIALGWDATEELRIDYAYDHSNMIGNSPAFQLWEASSTLLGSLAASGVNVGNLDISHKRLDNLSLDSDRASEHEISGHNLSVEYDLGFATIKSITTRRTWENTEAGTELDGNAFTLTNVMSPVFLAPPAPSLCGGAAAFPWNGTTTVPPGFIPPSCQNALATPFRADIFSATNVRHQDQWSQELQLTGDIGDSFRYVTGFYYFTEDFDEQNTQSLLIATSPFTPVVPLASGLTLANNGFVPFPLPTNPVPFNYSGDARSWALFANGTYTLPFLEERLSLTAGIRYSKDEKSFDRTSSPADSGSNTWDHIDWEANLNFLVTDNITTYFRAASAYKAGGYNLRSATAPLAPFDEEQLTSIEAGVKSEFFDNRVRLNFTGFWSLYKDLQTDVFAAGSSGATSVTVNAGEAEIPGLEAEFLAVPIDGLTINANVGWISPKYNEYNLINNNGTTTVCTAPGVPAGCLPDPSVDDFVENFADEAKFGYKPEVTTTMGVEYATAPIGSLGWVLTPRIDARYTASRVWSPLDDAAPFPDSTPYRDALKDEGYWLIDVRFTVSEIAVGERSKIRASLYGRNIFDEEYLLSGIDFGALGFAGGIFGEPATWGIDFTLDY